MKLPEFLINPLDEMPSATQPGQDVDLKTIVYRVNNGLTTGLSRIPLEYGDDDDDNPELNGMTAEYLDVMQDQINLEASYDKVSRSVKQGKRNKEMRERSTREAELQKLLAENQELKKGKSGE